MTANNLFGSPIKYGKSMGVGFGAGAFGSGSSKTKKRRPLTPGQRLYIWEHPRMYGRTCSICHQRITKQSELELDHTRAFSKGGAKQALAHRECNRIKGSGSLGKIQKRMGFKTTKRKVHKKKKKIRRTNSLGLSFGSIRKNPWM